MLVLFLIFVLLPRILMLLMMVLMMPICETEDSDAIDAEFGAGVEM